MNFLEKKHIIEKLMKDKLSNEEQKSLINNDIVSGYMLKQWNTLSDINDVNIKSRIFKNIRKNIWKNNHSKKVIYYKLSLIASVVLILVLSSIVFLQPNKLSGQYIYLAHSGIQNMELIALPDGSTVRLGPGTKLTYPEKFHGKTREVFLDGQAFFDVETDTKRPFIVHTSKMDINVLGTAFELFSHEIENTIEVILLEGKLQIDIPDNNTTTTKSQIVITPNEKFILNKQSNTFSKELVDANKYTAWRNNGTITFENEKLSMIIPRLEQWYGRRIICEEDLAEKYRFTFKVRDESLEKILFIMEESNTIKYEKTEGGDFILKAK